MSAGAAHPTICALATAAGEAAVGLVRLSGPRALELLQRATGRKRFAPRRLRLVEVHEPETGQLVDQVLAVYMPGPRSYTGEDVVEVSGHGGRLNMEQLLGVFVALGARLAGPGEFTRRAFVNGRLDLTQAEAVAELIAARSERALRNARALLGGALGQRVGALRAEVVRLAADLEACIDFADETEPAARGGLEAEHRRLSRQVARLADSYAQGRRLGGVSIALIGAVNAGKSSLFNALLGEQRALVSEEQGTTRDYLEAEVQWEQARVVLVDTAGGREHAANALERAGQALGRARVARCDLAVEVVDLNRVVAGWSPGWRATPELVAASKADLLEAEAVRARCAAIGAAGARTVVAVSADDGSGLDALRRAMVAAVLTEASVLGEGSSETVQVTQARQHEALRRAQAALAAGQAALAEDLAPELVVEHTREALAALGEITGETFTEDVLDAVFSRFCIGK